MCIRDRFNIFFLDTTLLQISSKCFSLLMISSLIIPIPTSPTPPQHVSKFNLSINQLNSAIARILLKPKHLATRSFEYLGIILDSKLTWKSHIQYIRRVQRSEIPRSTSYRWWSFHPFERPQIQPHTIGTRVQNHVIKLTPGATRSSPMIIPSLLIRRSQLLP